MSSKKSDSSDPPQSTFGTSNSLLNRKEYNRRAVSEYKTQSPTILQQYLIERSGNGEDMRQPFCESVYAAVMLADISGFTKLASQLSVEELKRHINNFFTLLLGNIIRKYHGDVIKFCGDAVLIMWSCPLNSSIQMKRFCATQATSCGLELIHTYGHYDSSEQAVSLRLHCGMSVGTLHCMSLGTSERMEFLISGKILQEMGLAESHSNLGEICLSKSAYELIENDFDGKQITTDIFQIIGSRLTHHSIKQQTLSKSNSKNSSISLPSLLLSKHKKRQRVYVDTVYDDEEETMDLSQQVVKGVGNLLHGTIENRDFKISLIRYVHESARKFILESNDFLAEIRMVATLFIQILNLDEDFNEGKPQRPQQVLLEILDIMKRLGGALRQYVVDDKGCVVICNFGVAGFSSNNDPLRAVSAAMSIKEHLKQCDITCRIGVTQGMSYCGYVGSKYRREYTVMGSSVNLAARLMSKALEDQILVDTTIFLGSQNDFEYHTLPKIEAKGYSTPVQVYSPVGYQENSTIEEVITRSQKSKVIQLVGRSYELTILSNAVSKILGQSSPNASFQLSNSTNSGGGGGGVIFGGLRNKQMSLRATLSQIIEESSTKNNSTSENTIGISTSHSFNFDEKLFSPRTVNVAAVSPMGHHSLHPTSSSSHPSPLDPHSQHPHPHSHSQSHQHHSLSSLSHSSTESENIYVIVGGPGYGKTTLINEVITRNAALMCPPIRINCHVYSMYEPYEVLGNLFEELMSHASLPPVGGGVGLKLRRNSSPQRRRKSLGQDLFHSISEEDETGGSLGGGGAGEHSSSCRSNPSNPEDPEYLRKQANENLFQSLYSWIEFNMPDTLFEYISNENIWKGSASTHKMDSKEDENTLTAPHLIPERVASCLRSRSSRKFSLGSVGAVGITIANKTKVFTAMEVVSLLRICLNTEELPSAQLLAEFTSNGLEDMISSLTSEVICQLLGSTKSKCLVIEDLHWCDKRSFEALMLTLSILEADSFFLGSMRLTESIRNSRKSYTHILSSEGSATVNSVEDLHIDCQILELHPFTKSDVKHLIRNTIGSSLIHETPNILSDENVSRILGRSNSIPGEVAEQVKELELSITRSKYGIIDRFSCSYHEENLLMYDELTKEAQMIVKIAAVCGMTFPLSLLTHTLTQMGYTSLTTNIEKSISQLEEKLVLKRVTHYSNTNQDISNVDSPSPHHQSLVSVKSRLLRQENSSLTLRHLNRTVQIDPKKRYYTFLNKSFREMIYSLMLSTQRKTAHGIIGDYLSNEYQDHQSHECQDAEALAFHYSKANDLLKEVYYTVEAAKLFQNQFKILTAYQHFHQLVILSTKYDSIESILQACCTHTTHCSYYEVFVKTLFKRLNFGQFFISTRYLKREDFLHSIQSQCEFIPTSHLSNFIAEMSILKYKLCDFNMSNNLFHLACHLRKMNSSYSFPASFYVKKYPSRCLYAMMFFYQGNISLLRGFPKPALTLYQQALSLLPKAESMNQCLILCAISAAELFVGSFTSADEYLVQAENLKVSVQFKESHCYLKLYSAILSFANGDFIETQRKIGIAASKYTNSKDFTPIRFQVENLLDWSYFTAGDVNLLGERINSTLTSLSGEDIPLGSLWYLELQSLCEILRGHYTIARQCLGSLGRYQKDHFGFYYQSSLTGFLLTCERKFQSTDNFTRNETFEKIIFSGRKLLERTQTCPIGMISLFLISYSALSILLSTTKTTTKGASGGAGGGGANKDGDEGAGGVGGVGFGDRLDGLGCRSSSFDQTTHSTHSNSYLIDSPHEIFRSGGGTKHRLECIAQSCYESLHDLSLKIKCLGLLCVSLRLKFAIYEKKKDPKLTLEYLDDLIYTIEYQQFAFGLLFFHLECLNYTQEFFQTSTSDPLQQQQQSQQSQQRQSSSILGGAAGGGGTVDGLELLLQKYHIPDNHFIIVQNKSSLSSNLITNKRVLSHVNINTSPGKERDFDSTGDIHSTLETATVTPFSS